MNGGDAEIRVDLENCARTGNPKRERTERDSQRHKFLTLTVSPQLHPDSFVVDATADLSFRFHRTPSSRALAFPFFGSGRFGPLQLWHTENTSSFRGLPPPLPFLCLRFENPQDEVRKTRKPTIAKGESAAHPSSGSSCFTFVLP